MKTGSKLALATAAAVLTGTAVSGANPHPLPYSYPYQTLPRGKVEVEEIVDMIPMRVAREKADGTRDAVTALRSQLQTEIEIGVRDRLELGLYFSFHQSATAATPAMRFDGIKQRLRYRVAEEGDLPVDLGVYLEIAELYNEVELEQKLLISRRFGYLTTVCNLWIEQEYYFQTQEWKLIYNPTLAAAYEFSPNFTLGLEYWARGRFDEPSAASTVETGSDSPAGARHFLGPTVFVQSGEAWWSTGVYARLDHFGEALRAEDPYGKVWVRTMVGLGF